MAQYKIDLGNSRNSPRSMRAWLALTQSGAKFEELAAPTGVPSAPPTTPTSLISSKEQGPTLAHAGGTIKGSNAIFEYLAEQFPKARLWPVDADARSHARHIVKELDEGFSALRSLLETNASPSHEFSADADADLKRLDKIWHGTRAEFGRGGAYLFGRWSLADAAYAPMVRGLLAQNIKLEKASARYCEAVSAFPSVRLWATEFG